MSDAAGNPATATRTVNVVAPADTTAPVITLMGDNPRTLTQGTGYSEPGFTAMDNVDGNITSSVAVTGIVNSNAVGQYTLSYNVSDAAGNPAVTVTRTVNVVAPAETTAPVIGTERFRVSFWPNLHAAIADHSQFQTVATKRA